jgi:hypothetical protein
MILPYVMVSSGAVDRGALVQNHSTPTTPAPAKIETGSSGGSEWDPSLGPMYTHVTDRFSPELLPETQFLIMRAGPLCSKVRSSEKGKQKTRNEPRMENGTRHLVCFSSSAEALALLVLTLSL